MNAKIEDFVAQCVASELADEQAKRDEAARKQREYEAAVKAQWAVFMDEAPAAVPEILRPYIAGHNGDESSAPYRSSLCIGLPDCTQLLAKFDMKQGHWRLESYYVTTYELVTSSHHYDDDVDYKVKFDRLIEFKADRLDLAVAYAFEAEQKHIEFAIEANLKNQERASVKVELEKRREAEEQRQAEKEEADGRAYAQRKTRDDQERDVALAFVCGDRVALALALVFKAIDAERQDWVERLESSEHGAESSVEFYEQKLGEARSQAEAYRHEVQDERSHAVDLEDEVTALKKKAKR